MVKVEEPSEGISEEGDEVVGVRVGYIWGGAEWAGVGGGSGLPYSPDGIGNATV